MTPHEFQNALRIMWSLDRHELVDAGVIDADNESAWKAFRDCPHKQAIRLDEARFARLFDLIASRQPATDDIDALERRVKELEAENRRWEQIILEIERRASKEWADAPNSEDRPEYFTVTISTDDFRRASLNGEQP